MKVTSGNIQKIYDKYNLIGVRAIHSLKVADLAAELARALGASPEKAWTAGALHDLQREIHPLLLLKYAEEHHLGINLDQRKSPLLLHGKVAADIVNKELGIKDEKILDAIRTHTCGEAGMEPLQAIVYAADFLESFSDSPTCQDIHDACLKDLSHGINLINQDSLAWMSSIGRDASRDFRKNLDYYAKY